MKIRFWSSYAQFNVLPLYWAPPCSPFEHSVLGLRRFGTYLRGVFKWGGGVCETDCTYLTHVYTENVTC